MATDPVPLNVKGHVLRDLGVPGLRVYRVYTPISPVTSQVILSIKDFTRERLVAPGTSTGVQHVTRNVNLGLHSGRVQLVPRFAINRVVGIPELERKNLSTSVQQINPTRMLVYAIKNVVMTIRLPVRCVTPSLVRVSRKHCSIDTIAAPIPMETVPVRISPVFAGTAVKLKIKI
tara:strand:- start:1546 stop:2070 length:525 start_codon:yes stop_codon:yes gene_type:complete